MSSKTPPNGRKKNPTEPVDETGDEERTIVVQDLSVVKTDNAITRDKAFVPRSEQQEERLRSAKEDVSDAKARNNLHDHETAKKQVTRLSKRELTEDGIKFVVSNLRNGSATYVDNGQWQDDGAGNPEKKFGILCNQTGKLMSSVKDVMLNTLDNPIKVVRDGIEVETDDVFLSEYLAHIVFERELAFRADPTKQAILKGMVADENSTLGTPQREEVTKNADGTLDVACDLRLEIADMAVVAQRTIETLVESGAIEIKDADKMPFGVLTTK